MREKQSKRAADRHQDERFDHQLPGEPQTAAAERYADGQFLLTRSRPCGEEVREVETCDGQDETGHHPHRQEHSPDVLDEQLPDERQPNGRRIRASGHQGSQRGLGTRQRRVGRQTAEHFEVAIKPVIAARAARAARAASEGRRHRLEDLGVREEIERCGQDADDRRGDGVERDGSSDYRAIGREAARPKAVTDEGDGGLARLEVRGCEGSPHERGQRGIEADERRKRRGDPLSPDLFGMAIRRQHEVSRLDGGEMLDVRGTCLEVTEVG